MKRRICYLIVTAQLFVVCALAGDESLPGLSGVEVTAASTLQDNSQVVAHIELALRKSGIRVLTEQQCDQTPGRPVLGAVVAPSVVSLELRQDVALVRNPRIQLHAVTWGHRVSSSEAFTARDALVKLDEFLETFMNDFLKHNQRSVVTR